jgi:hypothetical protein
MNYMGSVRGGDFLKAALWRVPADMPYRGPNLYQDGDYTYTCAGKGDFDWFTGNEEIYKSGEKIYECVFHGGAVKGNDVTYNC